MKTTLITMLLLSSFLMNAQEEKLPSGAHIPTKIQEQDNFYQQLYEDNNSELGNMKGTGYMPYQRLRHFYEQRRHFDGQIHPQNRWEIFQNMRRNISNNRTGTPVAHWENLGPNSLDDHGGRMISHAFDPLVPDVLWAGSASGGLWLTEDGGENWQAMTNDIPSTGVGSVAVHPQNSNILIIGTGEGFTNTGIFIKGGIGVFKSIDRGLTWLPTSFSYPSVAGISVLKIAWHPTNANVIWMATTFGLWKSEDMGDNWILMMGDGTNHQNAIFDDLIIQPDNPDIIFVTQENVGVHKSIDGGEHFSLLTNGLPTTDINFISITQCNTQPDILYTSIAKLSDTSVKGVYKSENNGASWAKLTNAPNAFCIQVASFSACQGWYNNTITVSPIDPDLVFFGGISFWRSDDGGSSWVQKDVTLCASCVDTPPCKTYVDHHDFGFDPHNEFTSYSFNDGGISKSINGGDCWINVNNGLVTGQLFSLASGRSNPDVIIGGFQDHGLQGVNIGNNLDWERWAFFDGANAAIDPFNENIFYGTWIDGTYWKSTNGTNSLAQPIGNGLNYSENNSVHFAPIRVHPTESQIILGSTQQGIYKSTNGGLNWQKKQIANVVSDLAFSQADPSKCYAAAWNGSSWLFYRSNDTGETWQTTNAAPGWRVTDVKTSGINPETVFASRNSINAFTPHVYKSTDGGDSWTGMQGDMPDITVNAIAVDLFNDDVVYAATDLGVFVTCNGGTNWTEFNDNMPVTFVTDIEFNPVDTTLRIATYGRGIWMTDGHLDNMVNANDIPAAAVNDFVVFPNPTNGHFSISFSIENAKTMELNLLNYLGQKVATIYSGSVQSNKQIFDIQMDKLMTQQSKNGIYFVGLKTPTRSFFKKLILVE